MSEGQKGKRPRGRPALPPEKAKRYAVGIRTTKRIKDLLQEAADSSGRSLAQEIEFRLENSFFGGPQTAALFGTLAALVGGRDDAWLDDNALFNTITSRWAEHLKSIRPRLGSTDEAQVRAEFEELKALAKGSPPESVFRRHARRIAETGYALDPVWRSRYAALAIEEESEP